MYELTLSGSDDAFLRYACVESAAGRLLVLMSERGVVDVILGDERSTMLSSAARRFPSMGFIPDRGAHAEWVAAVVKRLEVQEYGTLIPVDLRLGYGLRAAG